jgi:hypothetical protein
MKVELVVEAIEALVLATVVSATDIGRAPRQANYENLCNARDAIRESLHDLLKPTLRVVTGGPPALAVSHKLPRAETARWPGGIDDLDIG